MNTKKHHHANQRNKVILQYTAEQLHEGEKTNTGFIKVWKQHRIKRSTTYDEHKPNQQNFEEQ